MQTASSAFSALSGASAGYALTTAHALVPLTRGFAAAGAATTAGITAFAVATSSVDQSKLRESTTSFFGSFLPTTALCLERILVDNDIKKQYKVDVKTFGSTFAPSAVFIRAVLNLGVSFSRVVTDWLEEAAAIEEEARNHPSGEPQRPLPKFEWEQPFWASVGLFVRETCVVLTRRAVEKALVMSSSEWYRSGSSTFGISPKLAAKMLKDVPRSARRKCERLAWEKRLSRSAKASGMALTAARATITRITAEFIIATSISTVACRKLYQLRKSGALPAPDKEDSDKDSAKEETESRFAVEIEVGTLYARLLLGHLVKGGCWLIGGAVGAGLVAAARKDDCPKLALRLTFLGMAAGEAAGMQLASTALALMLGRRR